LCKFCHKNLDRVLLVRKQIQTGMLLLRILSSPFSTI
jgi:hypothetical protein